MAVYEFKGGQFERLAASLDDFDGTFRNWNETVAAFAEAKGMHLLDEVEGVYQLFVHTPEHQTFSRLRAYRWWFCLVDEVDVMDQVLIPDSLPDFLAFMGMLKPLVDRRAAVKQEVREALE